MSMTMIMLTIMKASMELIAAVDIPMSMKNMNMFTHMSTPTHMATHVVADIPMRAQVTMSMKNMNTVIPTRTVTHVVVATSMKSMNMVMPMSTPMHMAMHVVADMITKVSMNTVIPTRTAMHVVADMIMPMRSMRMNILTSTHTVTHVAVATTMNIPMSMHMLIHTLTTFLVTPLTASAKFAIRMRNTAMFAAKA